MDENTKAMQNKSFQARTIKGYDLYEVSSAFQKSVRRGLEKEAMYWAIELYESGYDKYLWKRILVIVSEDIGLADHNAVNTIYNLYNIYQTLQHKKDSSHKPERMPLTHAILYLVRCQKSRLVDWALNVFWDEHFLSTMDIPSWALDKHTRRGKAMGKTIKDFFNEGSFCENHKSFTHENEYKELCRERWSNPQWNEAKNAARAKYNAKIESDQAEEPVQEVQSKLFH